MKLKLFTLLLLLTLAFTALVSCDMLSGMLSGGTKPEGEGEENGGEGNKEEEKEKDNLIYNTTSELYIIVDPTLQNSYLDSFISSLSSLRSEPLDYAAVDSEEHKHEIVIGNTDRAISRTARDRLARITKNTEDEYSFLIYSDGSSIALVWDEDEDGVTEDMALEYFASNYVKEELTMRPGTDETTYDLIEDYYGAIDAEYKEDAWKAFEKQYGKELTASFKALYSICNPEVVVWLANLYDPDICVCQDLYGEEECSNTKYCGTGGFYFSNSGRDTMGYLPDAESTGQAIGLLEILGLAYKRGGDPYYGVLTEEMREAVGDFAYSLGEPNGYFYHPQWSVELVDSLSSRRSRDLSHCVGILGALGRTPKYTTATGVKGEDVLGTSGELTGRFGRDVVSAVSYVISTADSYDPNLQDLDSFKRYLSGLNIKTESYPVGNTLTAMTPQIQERDRKIGTPDDPTPLMDYLIEWLNENQNPETGTWDYKKPTDPGYGAYDGVNGLLKISGIYKAHGVLMPYSREAANSAMAAIADPTPINAVVDIYNTWYVLGNIIKNVRSCGGSEGNALATEILDELRVDAVDTILITRDKLNAFIRPDGSASYYKDKSCPVSQGAPVAVSGPVEGDVNATVIVVGQVISLVANALEITRIQTFGEVERAVFIKTVSELGGVVKDSTGNAEPIDFEDDEVGEESSSLKITHGGNGTAYVVSDPTGSGKGNVTEIVSYSGAADTIRINNTNSIKSASTYVFEGDFCVMNTSATYAVQLRLGTCYMLTFKNVSEQLEIWEATSEVGANLVEEFTGISPKIGNWFRLRVEYYVGDHDTVRIKLYADTDLADSEGMKLYAVSDNYYDINGEKVFKGEGTPSTSFDYTQILVLSAEVMDMYVDNLNSYKTNLKYEKPTSEDSPYINIDPPETERKLYDFDTESGDDLILEGNFSTEQGALKLSDGGKMYAPMNVLGSGARCAYVSAKIKVDEGSAKGSSVVFRILDGSKAILDYVVKNEGDYLSIAPKGAVSGPIFEEVSIPLGKEVEISLEYFQDGDIVILYIDGAFVGASSYLYADGIKARADGFAIISEGAGVIVDDVISEKKRASFEDAVAPKIPTKVYDFEQNDGTVTVSGGASITNYGTDGVLKLDSTRKASVASIPVNVRSGVVNKAYVSFELSYLGEVSDGLYHYVDLCDKSGNVIVSYALKVSSRKIQIFENSLGGVAKTPLHTYSSLSAVKIGIELYTENRVAYILDGGKKVAKSGIFSGAEYIENGIYTLTLRSAGAATLTVDDLVFETLYGVFEDVSVGSANTENDITSGIDFESSSSGSLPTAVKNHLVNSDASLGITNLYNDIKEEYSNVLAFGAVAGTNDAVAFVKDSAQVSKSAVVFEADLMVDLNSEGYSYQIFFADKPSGNCAYLLQIEHRAGKVIITDNSNSNNNAGINNKIYTDLNAGEWFNIRMEYYKSTSRDALRVKIYINGELIEISNNFYGKENSTKAPGGAINSAMFYSLNSTDGYIYVDNLTFAEFDGVCTDDVGEFNN